MCKSKKELSIFDALVDIELLKLHLFFIFPDYQIFRRFSALGKTYAIQK